MVIAQRYRPRITLIGLFLLTTVLSLWFAVLRLAGDSLLAFLVVVHATAPINSVLVVTLMRRSPRRERVIAVAIILGTSAIPLLVVGPFVSDHAALGILIGIVSWAVLIPPIALMGDWLFRVSTVEAPPPVVNTREPLNSKSPAVGKVAWLMYGAIAVQWILIFAAVVELASLFSLAWRQGVDLVVGALLFFIAIPLALAGIMSWYIVRNRTTEFSWIVYVLLLFPPVLVAYLTFLWLFHQIIWERFE
jgi:hypothetical protein